MHNYLFLYHDEARKQPTPEEGKKEMERWTKWFESLGQAVADGGAPVMPAATVKKDSVTDGAVHTIGGYSVLKADSKEQAAEYAKTCPTVEDGGWVEIYQTLAVS